ncbi:CAP and S-layer homology domain-containing protein [Paenibacillus eucommiae]|uniref:Uncharacterized protein YkwD n=1 Tax=Paenibacillus eucommiae TaxID=1355755 RepID=A0ABS4J1B9_9BACL|nr:S-layer homology domain-containing protein [Paenibacillus eucommiae]MBP1993627.1 uncharacterized protein YkwD [Paenibacillus eucommiae]
MKKGKITSLSLLIVLFVIVSLVPAYAEDSQFTDLKPTHWAYSAIQWAYENKVVDGYPDGTFKPNKEVSEAEFLTIFIQSYEKIDRSTPMTHWADSIYKWAENNNYPVQSYKEVKFRDRSITRKQVAEIIVGANGFNQMGDKAIQYLLDHGYTQGKTGPTVQGYRGQDLLTRAEAVQFIKNLKSQGMDKILPRPPGEEPNSNGSANEGFPDKLLLADGMYPLTDSEKQLASLINKYREKLGLAAYKLSKSMTKVARYHAYDANVNGVPEGECNLHSWTEQKTWTGGCYTPDHRNAALMWDKPREITDGSYKGEGFEIAYWHSSLATPSDALEGWKKSSGHHDLIIGKGPWSDLSVMGVAIEGNYAFVWFGTEKDPNGYFSE